MIVPSTDFSLFADAIRAWAADSDCHYVKQSAIVDTIKHDGRTWYTRYARIGHPLSDALLMEHLSRKVTLALPLTRDGIGSHIVFVYDGEAPERFAHLFEHLMHTRQIDRFKIFPGERDSSRLAVLYLPAQPVASLHAQAKTLSTLLEKKMIKSWKILPDPSLPDVCNIVTLPHIN
jgi:hypothetical protein